MYFFLKSSAPICLTFFLIRALFNKMLSIILATLQLYVKKSSLKPHPQMVYFYVKHCWKKTHPTFMPGPLLCHFCSQFCVHHWPIHSIDTFQLCKKWNFVFTDGSEPNKFFTKRNNFFNLSLNLLLRSKHLFKSVNKFIQKGETFKGIFSAE